MIGPYGHHSGHGGRLCEANSRGGEEKESVHCALAGSGHAGYHGCRVGHEGDRGQNQIATRQMEESEPTESC